MITTKIKPLNENPNKVLALLNENIRNLPYLVMQYDHIIELYLTLLGAPNFGRPNCNEVILPEIINLLETSNYHCKFTNSGIYQNDQAIFTVSENTISIINGDNHTNLSKECILCNNGILSYKEITDFEKFDINSTPFLSDVCYKQIQEPNLSRNLILNNIIIHTSIVEGIELSKHIIETYQSEKNPDDDVAIISTISYHPDEPTINYKIEHSVSDSITENKENYISLSIYGANPSPINEKTTRTLNGYGTPKLVLEADYQEKYDNRKLLENIQSYKNKYPNAIHPFYFYRWKTDLGKNAFLYLSDHLSCEKNLNL